MFVNYKIYEFTFENHIILKYINYLEYEKDEEDEHELAVEEGKWFNH